MRKSYNILACQKMRLKICKALFSGSEPMYEIIQHTGLTRDEIADCLCDSPDEQY